MVSDFAPQTAMFTWPCGAARLAPASRSAVAWADEAQSGAGPGWGTETDRNGWAANPSGKPEIREQGRSGGSEQGSASEITPALAAPRDLGTGGSSYGGTSGATAGYGSGSSARVSGSGGTGTNSSGNASGVGGGPGTGGSSDGTGGSGQSDSTRDSEGGTI